MYTYLKYMSVGHLLTKNGRGVWGIFQVPGKQARSGSEDGPGASPSMQSWGRGAQGSQV